MSKRMLTDIQDIRREPAVYKVLDLLEQQLREERCYLQEEDELSVMKLA